MKWGREKIKMSGEKMSKNRNGKMRTRDFLTKWVREVGIHVT